MESRPLSDLAKLTGLKPRTLQFWTTSGVIQPDEGTKHGGPGVHRRYRPTEVIIACIIAELSKFNFQVGMLGEIASYLRESMDFGLTHNLRSYNEALKLLKESKESNNDWECSDLKVDDTIQRAIEIETSDNHLLELYTAILGGIAGHNHKIVIHSKSGYAYIYAVISAPGEFEDLSSYLTINLARVLLKVAS